MKGQIKNSGECTARSKWRILDCLLWKEAKHGVRFVRKRWKGLADLKRHFSKTLRHFEVLSKANEVK